MRRIALMLAFALLLLGICGCKAGSITYDSGTNTITIVGFNESSPCTFEDIYQADVANGWGVVSKFGNNVYRFECALQIGDGSTPTYFADTNKIIDIHYISGTSYSNWYIKSYATATFGKLDDEEEKRTSRGCVFFYSASDSIFRWLGDWGGNLYLYSTTIYASKTEFWLGRATKRIWNCLFTRRVLVYDCSPDIYRVTVSATPVPFSDTAGSLEDVVIYSPYVAIEGWYGSLNNKKFRGIKAIHNVYAVRMWYFSGNFYLIDSEFDNWKFDWRSSSGKVYRQYTFNLKVMSEGGSPVSDAKVSVYDKDGNLIFEETTDVNGQIPEKIITRGYYNPSYGSTLVDFSPHTLVIEREGYETYTMQFTPTKAIDWQVSLKKAGEEETEEGGIIEVKEERKGKSDIGEGLVLGLGFGIALLAITFFVMKGGGRE